MDKLEKVERLRERADVSYEEAKAALDAAGDDLLEAMILLEKQGKAKAPEQSTYSTQYEEQAEYTNVQETVEKQQKESAASSFGHTIGRLLRTVFTTIRRTSFEISRKESVLFTMPTWVAVIILFLSWRLALPAMVIALFFGFRYHLNGREDDTRKANDILNKAADLADEVEQEFNSNKDR